MEKTAGWKGYKEVKTVSQVKKELWSPEEIERTMFRSWYYLNSKNEPVPWAEQFSTYKEYLDWWGSDATSRNLFIDIVGPATVSTVFLGLDHNILGMGPPVLFESMIFGGKYDGEMQRYTSYLDAKDGHEAMVKKLPSGLTRKQLEDGAKLIRKLME
jgi:hypothetical protein